MARVGCGTTAKQWGQSAAFFSAASGTQEIVRLFVVGSTKQEKSMYAGEAVGWVEGLREFTGAIEVFWLTRSRKVGNPLTDHVPRFADSAVFHQESMPFPEMLDKFIGPGSREAPAARAGEPWNQNQVQRLSVRDMP